MAVVLLMAEHDPYMMGAGVRTRPLGGTYVTQHPAPFQAKNRGQTSGEGFSVVQEAHRCQYEDRCSGDVYFPPQRSGSQRSATHMGGTLAPVGTSVIARLKGNAIVWNTATSVEEIVCSCAEMVGTVTKNSGSMVEVEFVSVDVSGTGAKSADNGLGECTGMFGPVYVTVTRLPSLFRALPTYSADEVQSSANRSRSHDQGHHRWQRLETHQR